MNGATEERQQVKNREKYERLKIVHTISSTFSHTLCATKLSVSLTNTYRMNLPHKLFHTLFHNVCRLCIVLRISFSVWLQSNRFVCIHSDHWHKLKPNPVCCCLVAWMCVRVCEWIEIEVQTQTPEFIMVECKPRTSKSILNDQSVKCAVNVILLMVSEKRLILNLRAHTSTCTFRRMAAEEKNRVKKVKEVHFAWIMCAQHLTMDPFIRANKERERCATRALSMRAGENN